MKTKYTTAALLLAFVLSLGAAEPITFNEVSLLVRLREKPAYIVQQLSSRRLLRPLTTQQEATLKAQGASDTLLRSLRDPDLPLSASEAGEYEARRAEAQKQAVTRMAAPSAPTPALLNYPPPATPSGPVIATGKSFVIDRIQIISDPIPQPYFVHIRARAGRSEKIFSVPQKAYGSRSIAQSEISIPLNLKLEEVQENTSAILELHIDHEEKNVDSYKALSKHTARILMTDGPKEEMFIPMFLNTQFVYKVFCHME